MAADPLSSVRKQVGLCVDEIRDGARRLSPLDIHARIDGIRRLAADHGLDALEGLARCSAQHALLPGHRLAMHSCLDQVGDALGSRSAADRTAILALLAVRLH